MGDAIPIPWDAYTSSVITIELPTGRLVAEPTDDDPEGRLPNGLAEPVHVITAWNPGSRELEADDNDTRNAEMRAVLDRRNAAWFPARGAAPDDSWHEDGFAVTGWSRQDACALARAHGQAAVFELLTGQLAVVAADLDRVEARPCTILGGEDD